MPVYARQLGFSSFVVGSIYSVLPILGLVAKPLFGALADRYIYSINTRNMIFFRCFSSFFLLLRVMSLICFFFYILGTRDTRPCSYFSYF